MTGSLWVAAGAVVGAVLGLDRIRRIDREEKARLEAEAFAGIVRRLREPS